MTDARPLEDAIASPTTPGTGPVTIGPVTIGPVTIGPVTISPVTISPATIGAGPVSQHHGVST